MNACKPDQWKWWTIDVAGIFCCLLVAGAVYQFGFKPIVDREVERRQQKGELTQEEKRAENLQIELSRLKGHLIKLRAAVDRSAIQLQSTSYLNQRVSEVTELATECGLQVNKIQPKDTVSADRYDMVPIQIVGIGTYQSASIFLHRLQDRFPDTGVSSFELVKKSSAAGLPASSRNMDRRSEDGASNSEVGSFDFALVWYAAPTVASK